MSHCAKCGKDVYPGIIICESCVMAMFGKSEQKKEGLPADVKVLWLCTCQYKPIGIVKTFDEYSGHEVFYIGIGSGGTEEQDVRAILEWGQKFDNLDFIKEFATVTTSNRKESK